MPDLHASLPITPKPATEPALARLYGAAVGSMRTAYYLSVFDRFEALGRWRSSWNWTAATLTLNWLLFRQLRLAALAYGSVLLLFPILVLGLGRHLFALPPSVELGLWLSFILLSVVLPGLWGNALLYVDCQRRVNLALTESATLEQACALLRGRASTRKHVIGLCAANALLAGLLLSAYVGWSEAPAIESNVSVRGPLLNVPVAAASRVQPVSMAAPAVPTASSFVSPASSAATASSASSAATAVVRAASTASPASAVLAVSVPARVFTSAPASAAVSWPASTSSSVSVPARIASTARAASAAKVVMSVSAPNAPIRVTSPASTPASAALPVLVAGPASSPSSGHVFVNVGLFGQVANARQVHGKLVAAGLPAVSEPINNAQGQQRTRVRVGPFVSRAQGQAAVLQIKALQLEAVLAP